MIKYYEKIISIFQEFGFWKIVYEVMRYILLPLYKQLNSIKFSKKKVVIISGCRGDSMRYRAFYQQEQLIKNKLETDIFEVDTINWKKILSFYGIYILHRVRLTTEINNAIDVGKKMGKIFVYDSDDLVFSEDYAEETSFINSKYPGSKERFLNLVRENLATLQKCNYAIASTEKIYKEFKKQKVKNVYINQNSVGDELIDISAQALSKKKMNTDNKVTLGYISGTKTHNKDFAHIENVILKILDKFPNVKLKIFGFLHIDDKFAKYSDRISRIRFVPWRLLPYEISSIDINLAPLENTNFNEGKSDLKYFETALLQIPTVASRIGEFKTNIVEGHNGFLAESDAEWEDKIIKLFDIKLRVTMGKAAFEDVIENRNTLKMGINLKNIIDDIVKKNG